MENVPVTNKKSILSKIPDNVKIAIFRWWLAGAVYFFIAWGTNLGMNADPLDLIFVLGLVLGVCHIFIFNPIVYGMFDIKRNGKIINKKYYERTIMQNIFLRLGEIFRCLIITVLIVATYELLNTTINSISGNTQNIPIKGEPFLFATFYIIYYFIYDLIKNLIYRFIDKKEANCE